MPNPERGQGCSYLLCTEAPLSTIYEICRDCATKLGWVPVPYAVGIWEGKCDLCKRTRPLCAPRDYRTKEGKHVNPDSD